MAGPEEFPYRQYAMSPMNQTLVSLTSILSMAGSLMIILSYIAWKDIQTVSRKVLVWLSICDFFIALGNICGTFFRPTMIETQDKKCIVQSFIMSAASISSFCWSVTLACCLYMTIIKNNYQLFVYLTPYFHIFNWSIGLLINTVAAEQKMLGNTHDEVTSGWCWIRHLNCSSKQHIHCSKEINWMLANYKAIEIVAYAAICFLYLLVKINLRREMKSQLQNLDTSVLKIAKSADRKLILLPIILVLARIPGTVRFLIFALNKTPSTLTLWAQILLVLQGIGDSSQGLINCIFFCFLQPRVRQHLKELLPTVICPRACRLTCLKEQQLDLRKDNYYSSDCDTSVFASAKDPLIDRSKLQCKSYN